MDMDFWWSHPILDKKEVYENGTPGNNQAKFVRRCSGNGRSGPLWVIGQHDL